MRWRDVIFVVCAFLSLSITLRREYSVTFQWAYRYSRDTSTPHDLPPAFITKIRDSDIDLSTTSKSESGPTEKRPTQRVLHHIIVALAHERLLNVYVPHKQQATVFSNVLQAKYIRTLFPHYQVPLTSNCIGFAAGRWSRSMVNGKGIAVVTQDRSVAFYRMNMVLEWRITLPLVDGLDDSYVPKYANVLVLSNAILQGDTGVVVVALPIAKDHHQTSIVFAIFALHARDGELRWTSLSRSLAHQKRAEETNEKGNTAGSSVPQEASDVAKAMITFEPPRYVWTNFHASMLRALPHRYDHLWKLHLRPFHFFIRKSAKKVPSDASSTNMIRDTEVYTALWKQGLKKTASTSTTMGEPLANGVLSDRTAAAWSALSHFTQTPATKQKNAQGTMSTKAPYNVVLIHLPNSVLALHLYTGEHVAHLGPLQAYAAYEDLNHDHLLDAAHVVLSDPSTPVEEFQCEGRVLTNAPYKYEVLHKVPLCHVGEPISATDTTFVGQIRRTLFGGDEGAAQRSPSGNYRAAVTLTAATPLTTRRVKTTAAGITEIVHDVIYYTSEGVVVSLNPKNGRVNWRQHTSARFGPSVEHDVSKDLQTLRAVYPHVTTYHPHILQRHVNDMYLVVVGETLMLLLDTETGQLLSSHDLASPIIAPILMGDFNNDGVNDLLVTNKDETRVYMGVQHRGTLTSLHALILCTLGLVATLFVAQVFQTKMQFGNETKVNHTRATFRDAPNRTTATLPPPLQPPPSLFHKRSTD